MEHDVVIIGAGTAGLACASALSALGQSPVVVDRSTGPGGRAATRELGGQKYDFGVLFVNSTRQDFLDWVSSTAGEAVVRGWPTRIDGVPAPCQPGSLDAHQTRFAFRGGIRVLADREVQRLADRGVNVQWGREATVLKLHSRGIEVHFSTGEPLLAHKLVLALAAPQTEALLDSLGPHPVARALKGVLELFPTLPCLTVSALYPASAPAPTWDLCYPENSPILHLATNQGALHHPGEKPLVVWQARPGWSMRRADVDRATWAQEILDEATRLFGAWAASPEQMRIHRWKYARLDGTGTAQRPLTMALGGGTVGLAGELFSQEGGVEGAWRSGRSLAAQWVSPICPRRSG